MSNLFKKSITTLALFGFMFGSVSVNANITTRPTPIELTKTSVPSTQAPFLFYFPYGSSTSDTDLTNQAAKVTITNVTNPGQAPAFEIVPGGNFDIFNGDPNRLATEAVPLGPINGCSTFTGTRYPMPASFFTTTGMNNYGLQTVKNVATSTGTFKQKSTGCMAFQLSGGANVKVGDQARITFDWDAAQSLNLQEAQRPANQTGLLEITTASVIVSSSSSSSSPSSSSSSNSSSSSSSLSSSSFSSSSMAMLTAISSSSSSSPSSSSRSSSDPCKVGSFFGGVNTYADGVRPTTTTTTTPAGGGAVPTTTTTTTPATTTTTTPTTTTTTTTTDVNCITKTVTTGGFGIAVLVGLMAIGGGIAVMIKTRKKEVQVDLGSK